MKELGLTLNAKLDKLQYASCVCRRCKAPMAHPTVVTADLEQCFEECSGAACRRPLHDAISKGPALRASGERAQVSDLWGKVRAAQRQQLASVYLGMEAMAKADGAVTDQEARGLKAYADAHPDSLKLVASMRQQLEDEKLNVRSEPVCDCRVGLLLCRDGGQAAVELVDMGLER